jgi:hypothetical protein
MSTQRLATPVVGPAIFAAFATVTCEAAGVGVTELQRVAFGFQASLSQPTENLQKRGHSESVVGLDREHRQRPGLGARSKHARGG